MIWNSIGHQLSCHRGREGLCVVTQVTALHILHYIVAHSWPPEAAHYQIHHLPSARVTNYWGVMEGCHYVMYELTIWGDIDSTLIEYQAILFLPFLMT